MKVNIPLDSASEPEEFEINRLILIGNGFDLALGMKTAYNDFILWYIRQMMTTHGSEDDILLTIIRNKAIDLPSGFDKYSLKQILGYCHYEQASPFAFNSDKKGFQETTNHVHYRFYIKNMFLHKLLLHCFDYNRVDIENEYDDNLKSTLPEKLESQFLSDSQQEVKVLNNALTCEASTQSLHFSFPLILNIITTIMSVECG